MPYWDCKYIVYGLTCAAHMVLKDDVGYTEPLKEHRMLPAELLDDQVEGHAAGQLRVGANLDVVL